MRLVLFWPFDAAGLLSGEDSYSDGTMFAAERIRKVAPDEVPESFHAPVG